LIWKVASDLYAEWAAGRMSDDMVVQLVLTWTDSFAGFAWAGLRNRLKPSIRGPLAYILGHRFLQLKNSGDAARFFQEDLADAPADSTLRRLSEAELDRLKPQGSAGKAPDGKKAP
jgi:hypothetical protein